MRKVRTSFASKRPFPPPSVVRPFYPPPGQFIVSLPRERTSRPFGRLYELLPWKNLIKITVLRCTRRKGRVGRGAADSKGGNYPRRLAFLQPAERRRAATERRSEMSGDISYTILRYESFGDLLRRLRTLSPLMLRRYMQRF